MRVTVDIDRARATHLQRLALQRDTSVPDLVAEIVRRAMPSTNQAPLSEFERRAAQRAELIRLHAEGHNDSEIGRRVGRKSQTVRSWRIRLGLPPNAGKGRPSHI